MNKKKLFLWSLYDFANSFVFINFLLYFSQWLVIDGGLHDFWYNALFAIAACILLLSAPILASYTDKRGGRKYFLNVSTVGTFVGYGAAALLAYFAPDQLFFIAIFFLLGQYSYQLSFTFYQPMIEEVADEKHRSRASGIGQFCNALGQILGIVVALPFLSSRLLPLFPSLVIFLVLALPMMVLFKESRSPGSNSNTTNIRNEIKHFGKKMKTFFSLSVATPMLVAFFFFNDALVTVSNNHAIFLERVFQLPDSSKSFILLGVLVMSAIGSIVMGWIGDKIGLLKALKIILLSWIILLPLLAVSPTVLMVSVFAVILGFFMGGIWSVSRAYMSLLLRKEEMAYGFSFYTIAERFSSFVGPLAWGGIILVSGTNPLSYRIAIFAMSIFVVVGLLVLNNWKRTKLTPVC
jgi:UMF1 family MFS transporter